MIEPVGGFALVHVNTPLDVCEQRRPQGACTPRQGPASSRSSPGISDPYEAPADAELAIDTTALTPDAAAQRIVLHLEKAGYVGAAD